MATQSKKNDIPQTGINQNGTSTIFGVHYGRTPDLKILTGSNDSPLFDSSRLSHTQDNRLTRRIHFYEKSGDSMPTPDGHGQYVYIAGLNGIYNPDTASDASKEEIAELMADNSTNEWESAILDAGYYGYVANGVITFLDGKVKVRYLGDTKSVEAQNDNPTATPTNLPVAPETKKTTSTKALPKPRKPRKAKTDTQVPTNTQTPLVEADTGLPEPSGVVSDDSGSSDVLEDIKKVFLSEEFTKNLAGKIAIALVDFNRASKEFELNQNVEKSDDKQTPKDVTKKDNTDKVTKLLEEIRQILKSMKTGTQKDIVSGQRRLEEIMSETSSFSSETHAFFQKSVNNILREIETGVAAKKEENPKPLKTPATVTPTVTSLPTGIVPTEVPTDFAVKSATQKVPELVEPKKDEPTSPKPSKPARQPKQKVVPKENDFVGAKKGAKNQKARIEKDDKGNLVSYRPSYKSMPSNLSGMDAFLGTIVNRNKNVSKRNPDGSYTHTLGANRIGYAKKLFRTVDQYVGAGETAKGLRKLGLGKRKPEIKTKDPSSTTSKVLPKAMVSTVPMGSTGSPLMPVDKPIVGKTVTPVPDIPEVDKSTTNEPSMLEQYGTPAAIGAALMKAKNLVTKIPGAVAKYAAPVAAGASAVEGSMDEWNGKKIDKLTDIIPEGTINKLNPFAYANNAGRYIGNKQNQYYGAVSKVMGGSGSLGSDIYDLFNDDPMVTKTDKPAQKPTDAPNVKPKTSNINAPVDRQFRPVPKQDYVNNNDYLTEQAMKNDVGLDKEVVTAPQTTVINNTTSNPVTQVMPNNPMTIRPMESAYSRYISKRVGG